MDEQKMRQIAREEYQKLGTRFGVAQVPVHYHNNIDSPGLSASSLNNVDSVTGQASTNIKAPILVFPVPIIDAVPPTATATNGTLVIGSHSGITKLYGRVGGVWVDLTGL